MRYTILFVIALILVSGFIAYFGDLLGRRMGKKRLTLFSLRPRHTAIIVTTITGMLISTFALVALISVNSQFKKVLTRGEEILAQNKQLFSANASLITKNRALSRMRETLEAQVAERQQEVIRARQQAAEAAKARDRAQAAVKKLQEQIAARAKELVDLKKRTDAAESQLTEKTRELDDVRTQLKTAQRKLDKAQDELSRAQIELVKGIDELSKKKDELAETEAKLAETQRELKAVEAEVAPFVVESAIVRQVQFIVHQGDEIVRGTVAPKQSEFGARADLYSLLERAGMRAVGMGAKAGANGRGVTVVYRVHGEGPEGRYAVLLDREPELVNSAIKTLVSAPSDVLVQVVSAVNTLPGEQVPVELKLYINKLVFANGDRVAVADIDGRLSEGRILLALSEFWKKDVSKAAVSSGIVPSTGLDQRSLVAANAEAQMDELLDVVDQVKALNAQVRVAVYATEDIYAADLLQAGNVRFSVSTVE